MEQERTKISWWKLLIFILFSVALPVAYLIVRYGLFTSTTTLNIGLWGIIVLAILIGSVVALIRFYLEGMKTQYSLGKQILEGVIRVILPLVVCLVIVVLLKDNVDKLIEALLVIIPCECVAIVFNPLPKWCFENNVEGIGNILETLTKRVKGEDKE